MIDAIGWVSSFILVASLSLQLRKQAKDETPKVSKCLYVGQLIAQVGFCAYSFMLENWVFLVTNIILALLNILGMYLTFKKHR